MAISLANPTTPTPGPSTDWYSQPLAFDDVFAGGFLIAFCSAFLPLYALVSYVMFKSDKDVIGFRFLFSASIADMLLLINYAFWPGITILVKSELISKEARHWVQMYLDWAWFSMCYHYMVIAWSRFAAIRFPNSFRLQSRALSYSICAGCYVAAAIQVLVTHFQPWYVTFYYEPSYYGMLAEDFPKYLTEGQSFFFFTFHLLMMIIPIFFYTFAIILLFKQRNSAVGTHSPPTSGKKLSSTHAHHFNVEARLIIPCIFNSVVFIIGQVVITIGTGEGKWASWLVMLLFSANSAVNPVLLIAFSAVIRRKLFRLFNVDTMYYNSRYMTVPNGRMSCSPSPPLIKKMSGIGGSERLGPSSPSMQFLAVIPEYEHGDSMSCPV